MVVEVLVVFAGVDDDGGDGDQQLVWSSLFDSEKGNWP